MKVWNVGFTALFDDDERKDEEKIVVHEAAYELMYFEMCGALIRLLHDRGYLLKSIDYIEEVESDE